MIRKMMKGRFQFFKKCLLTWLVRAQNWGVKKKPVDLAIIGIIKEADGIGRISLGIKKLLDEDIQVQCLPTNFFGVKNFFHILWKNYSHRGRIVPKVNIVSEQVSTIFSQPHHLLARCSISIAYSMIESTRIPFRWTKILNDHFDLVAVPDISLIEVYQNSGVKIPIFEVPLGMELAPFLSLKKNQKKKNAPFIFGTTISCHPRKNIPLLIQAFSEEFREDENIILRINSRFGDKKTCRQVIDSLKNRNIIFTTETLDQLRYVELMSSFDCFVNISMGEGFSICPREALALGIPCVLSNNTAHTTLCNTDFVQSVACPIRVPAFEELYGKEQQGYYHTCHLEDVKVALRDVYARYPDYLEKAQDGKMWVKRYQWEHLKNKYLNLVKPKHIVLSDQNRITDECLHTNSQNLYEKYIHL